MTPNPKTDQPMKAYINSARVRQFVDNELAKWPLAARNFEALKLVETRTLSVDWLTIKIQYNPARKVSTGAKVDRKSILDRPCFLCRQNRPPEQGSLHWGARYEVLVNPFPIFPYHLTIPEMSHIPQLAKGRGPEMIELARDLDGFAIFYNGANCGASAPDHMHFQACPKDELPLIAAIEQRMHTTTDSVELQPSVGFPFGFFVLDINKRLKPSDAVDTCRALHAVMDPSSDTLDYYAQEPMVNVICYDTSEVTRFVIIPRKRHRPSNYGEGPGQILVSPASVDLGGVFITPRYEDFESLTAADIRNIYRELCFNEDEIISIIDRI